MGQILQSVISKMVMATQKGLTIGEFNDDDGDFDLGLFWEKTKDAFFSTVVEVLIEKGFGSKADDLLDEYKDLNSKIRDLYKKREIQANRIRSGMEATKNGRKRIEKTRLAIKKTDAKIVSTSKIANKNLGNFVKKRATENFVKKGAGDTVNEIRRRKKESNKDESRRPERF